MEVLYRKYRPRKFVEVVGQDHVKKILLNAVRSGKVSHAYIFSGPRGTGKTTCARILAKSLNCLNPRDGEPCGECENCRAIDDGSFLDVIEIDAASNRGIDEIRKIRDRVSYRPLQGRYKVYIIDEFHMLTREAFNALLKTLEEPPPNVLFILATTNLEKVPPTIISRAQVLDFRPLPSEKMEERLREIAKKEGMKFDDTALKLIVRRSEGSLRDALSTLEMVERFGFEKVGVDEVESVLGLVPRDLLEKFLDGILKNDIFEIFEISDEIFESGKSPEKFMEDLVDLILDRLRDPKEENVQLLSTVSRKLTLLLREVRYSDNKRIVFETGILGMMNEIAKVEEKKLRTEVQSDTEDVVKEESDFEKYPEGLLKLMEYLKDSGDLSIFMSLIFSNPSEEEGTIILEYAKPYRIHYEIIRENLRKLEDLYRTITGDEKKFSPIYTEKPLREIPEGLNKTLRKILRIFPGKVILEEGEG
ncbi:MAG: DNA polymerase III subunit gamma/tau [Thermotogae bacterium]|nr:DNA polymerase III subunit gamma/tau [Thermotogota bacterium]